MTHILRAAILRAALFGLVVVAASCKSPTVSSTTPPAAPGGAAGVDLFVGKYRSGWLGPKYKLSRHNSYYRLHTPDRGVKIFVRRSSSVLVSKGFGTLTLGTLRFPDQSHQVLRGSFSHGLLLLIKQ